MNKQKSDRLNLDHTVTRRKFIGTTAASSAALLTGGLASLLRAPSVLADEPFIEATIPQLQAMMASGQLTSRQLTRDYIQRIESLNPLLHSVIQLNPNAIAIAAGLDNERRQGHVRGPLHGIPLLVKDNIATDDQMQTTAGSLAIYGNHVPGDAVIIQQLRAAGAIILGKSNLGEWANFRDDEAETYPLAVGWCAHAEAPGPARAGSRRRPRLDPARHPRADAPGLAGVSAPTEIASSSARPSAAGRRARTVSPGTPVLPAPRRTLAASRPS